MSCQLLAKRYSFMRSIRKCILFVNFDTITKINTNIVSTVSNTTIVLILYKIFYCVGQYSRHIVEFNMIKKTGFLEARKNLCNPLIYYKPKKNMQ